MVQAASDWLPDHVPAHLAWDADYYAFAEERPDPFRRVGELHAGPEILWVRSIDRVQPGWLPTRYSLIREVLSDTEHFISGATNMLGAIGVEWKLIPLEYLLLYVARVTGEQLIPAVSGQ